MSDNGKGLTSPFPSKLVAKNDVLAGRVRSQKRLIGKIHIRNRGKYGWIEHATSATDYYVRAVNFGAALPGDQVFFRIIPSSSTPLVKSNSDLKPEAEVVGIAKRKHRNIIVLVQSGRARLFNLDLQYCRVRIVNPPVANGFYYTCALEAVKNQCLSVRIENKISAYDRPDAQTQAVIRQLGILTTFNTAVVNELKQLPVSVTTDPVVHQQHRVDLTSNILVTIDGAEAQDFDDAIGVESLANGGFKLLVAIADVAHYVKPESALDQAAMLRGCSVYLPGQTLPMLPAKLSNDLCSLRPAVDRLVVVCEISFNQLAEVIATKLYRAIINSRARLTYEQVDRFLNDGQLLANPKINDMLKKAHQLAIILQKKYEAGGYISFNLVQQHLELDDVHKVVNIKINEKVSLSRKIIELFMITANQQVALFVQRQFKTNLLFRNHPPITTDKLTKVIRSSKNVLPQLKVYHPPKTPLYNTIQNIIDQLAQNPRTKRLIDYLVVHNLERAFYHEVNQKHFGLGIDYYTHFTSPIRRYPDLMVHRLLGLYFDGQNQMLYPPLTHHQIIEKCNMNEIKQTKCEQIVRKINVIKYMQKYQNRVFQALIKQVYRWGMKVELDNLVQGEVSVRAMINDYYQFEPEHEMLVGRRTHQTYQTGQMINVKLITADPWIRKIEFELVN